MSSRVITYAQAVREAMSEEMRRDPDVFVMGEDIAVYGGPFGVTLGMQEEFGSQRVLDTPISETAFMGAGIGAAITGMRPIVELMYSDFIAVCFDQIINQAAKMRYMSGGMVQVPLVIRTPSGGGTGAAAQHSQSLENLLCHIPGLKVIMPATPYDAKGLVKSAIRDNNCVIVFEPKLCYPLTGPVPSDDYTIPLGAADVKRAGKHVSIITYGRMVQLSLLAADRLAEKGVEVEVLDLRTLSPLDQDSIIKTVQKTARAVVVHEASQFAGFGGEIVSTIMESDAFYTLKAPVVRVGALHCPIPFSPNLEQTVLPGVEDIEQAVNKVLAQR